MAGGSPIHQFNAGEYNTTVYAKQGDLGTAVLKPRPSGTVWTRGATAKARWQNTANHGGGYSYRLCPASEPLTEECFQRHPLKFAGDAALCIFPVIEGGPDLAAQTLPRAPSSSPV